MREIVADDLVVEYRGPPVAGAGSNSPFSVTVMVTICVSGSASASSTASSCVRRVERGTQRADEARMRPARLALEHASRGGPAETSVSASDLLRRLTPTMPHRRSPARDRRLGVERLVGTMESTETEVHDAPTNRLRS